MYFGIIFNLTKSEINKSGGIQRKFIKIVGVPGLFQKMLCYLVGRTILKIIISIRYLLLYALWHHTSAVYE